MTNFKTILDSFGIPADRQSVILHWTLDQAQYCQRTGQIEQNEYDAFAACWNADGTKLTQASGALKHPLE